MDSFISMPDPYISLAKAKFKMSDSPAWPIHCEIGDSGYEVRLFTTIPELETFIENATEFLRSLAVEV